MNLLLLGMAWALAACEASTSQDGPAPSDGTLVINPNSTTIAGVGTAAAGSCVGIAGAGFVQATYVISTFDAQGRPLGNADIAISLDFAENTVGGGQVATTRLIDGETGAFVSTPASPVVYQTTTDDIGNKTMIVHYEFTAFCVYSGSMTVVSGNLVQVMDFSIEE